MTVYFIREHHHKDSPVKIGYSIGDGIERLKGLQTGNPRELYIAHIIPAAERSEEKLFHDVFEDVRIRGEWFRYEGKLKELLEDANPEKVFHELIRKYRPFLGVYTGVEYESEEERKLRCKLRRENILSEELNTDIHSIVVKFKNLRQMHMQDQSKWLKIEELQNWITWKDNFYTVKRQYNKAHDMWQVRVGEQELANYCILSSVKEIKGMCYSLVANSCFKNHSHRLSSPREQIDAWEYFRPEGSYLRGKGFLPIDDDIYEEVKKVYGSLTIDQEMEELTFEQSITLFQNLIQRLFNDWMPVLWTTSTSDIKINPDNNNKVLYEDEDLIVTYFRKAI